MLMAGGPSGGNGGNGGAVWAVADESLNSLTTFRKQLHYRAQPGSAGGGSNRHGSNGSDLDIHVSTPLSGLPNLWKHLCPSVHVSLTEIHLWPRLKSVLFHLCLQVLKSQEITACSDRLSWHSSQSCHPVKVPC